LFTLFSLQLAQSADSAGATVPLNVMSLWQMLLGAKGVRHFLTLRDEQAEGRRGFMDVPSPAFGLLVPAECNSSLLSATF
jgi:hypothetical protein